MVATSVMTARATIKANDILLEAKYEKGDDLSFWEKVNVTLPVYVPTILMGVGTIGCVLGANVLNKQHQKALTSAYILLDQSFKEYKNKVVELYGEEADEKIEAAIEEEHLKDDGSVRLFYDEYSDQYFESTLFEVQRAEYELNRKMLKEDCVFLNDWYEELGIKIMENGFAVGWSTFQCMEMYWQPWIDFDHYTFTTKEGRECTGISFVEYPVLDFEEWC